MQHKDPNYTAFQPSAILDSDSDAEEVSYETTICETTDCETTTETITETTTETTTTSAVFTTAEATAQEAENTDVSKTPVYIVLGALACIICTAAYYITKKKPPQ